MKSLVKPSLLFLAPAMFVLGAFYFLPIAAALVLSLTDFDIYALADSGNARWVGLENYRHLLHESRFWTALVNTLYFVGIGGTLTVVLSLSAALLVSSKLTRLKSLWRTIFFAPVVTTLVAVAVVWRYLYHTRYGTFNYALGWFGIHPIDWLGNPHWAMFAIILLAVWKNFGYNMVIFVAGLQSIPDELYEAARIDGAGAWHSLVNIKLPMLAPTFFFVGVTTMIGYFQLFAEPYVMTLGGPLYSTYSIVMFMYEEGFRWWRVGYASAIAFVLFAIILVFTAIQTRLQRGSQA
ncbi:MAG TPA: sugar ABC transporter permease [Lacipirellulaceae bacterium]|nr:sugar ABC transporter permease [Lacipirellulaceae bacterium]